ncbi:MAG: hypothetical protein ACOCYO_03955 [Bacteroidota bacterium]
MKNTAIVLKYTKGQSETRKALEWAFQKVSQCETLDELKVVWKQFYALQGTWQFQMKVKQKKNEILSYV